MLSTTNRLATLSNPLEGVRREFRRDFDGNGNSRRVLSPQLAAMTLHTDESHIFLELDVPGVGSDDLDLTFEDGKLFIRGRRPAPESDAKCRYEERRYGEFQRIVALDDTIDPSSIDARLDGGVLYVTLSKKPEAQPRRVDVKYGGAAKK